MVIQESYPVQADDMTAAGDVSARIKQSTRNNFGSSKQQSSHFSGKAS